MKVLLVIAVLAFIFVLVFAITKARSATDGGISTYKHPSTFKKPDIEMVNKPAHRDDSSIQRRKIMQVRHPDTSTLLVRVKVAHGRL